MLLLFDPGAQKVVSGSSKKADIFFTDINQNVKPRKNTVCDQENTTYEFFFDTYRLKRNPLLIWHNLKFCEYILFYRGGSRGRRKIHFEMD